MFFPEIRGADIHDLECKPDPDNRALARPALCRNRTAHHIDQLPGQPDPRSGTGGIFLIIGVIAAEIILQLLLVHTDAGVPYFEDQGDILILLIGSTCDSQLNAAPGRSIFHSVGENSPQNFHDPGFVADDDIMLDSFRREYKFLAVGLCQAGKSRADLIQHQSQPKLIRFQAGIHRFNPAHIQYLVQGGEKFLACHTDPVRILQDFGRIL